MRFGGEPDEAGFGVGPAENECVGGLAGAGFVSGPTEVGFADVHLLAGCFCRAESARPLIGCLDMDIVCRRQCSDQSEARIPVTERYGILTSGGPGAIARCLAYIYQSEVQI